MDTPLNFSQEFKHIQLLLDKEEYTVCARECVIVIEQSLQHVLIQNLEVIEENVRDKVQNAIRKCDCEGREIQGLTMGQIIFVLQESKFIETLEDVSEIDLSRYRLLNLDELRKLRNKFMHDARKATKPEADFLAECLAVILTDFRLVDRQDIVSINRGQISSRPPRLKSPVSFGVKLEKDDFRTLTQLVQNLPEFGMERDRRRLVADALEGEPKADMMLARLDLGGSPRGAAIETMRFLQGFGQVADGKQALAVFLNSIKDYLGEEEAEFIDTLFAKYPLDATLIVNRPLDQWRGKDSPEAVKEKIIGENTLRHVNMLELALEASRAVVHLRITKENGQEAFGTGFLISPGLLMTNQHVIATHQEAIATEYTFNYQLGIDGTMQDVIPVKAMTDGVFYTNPTLDFTLLQLAEQSGRNFGFVRMKPVRVSKDSRVSIIQHPGGHFKQISMQSNFVVYADAHIVQYTTSTLPGSSGSPVFDDTFAVIALHHSGGHLKDPETGMYELRNEGTSACAILEDLKQHAAEIYRLVGA